MIKTHQEVGMANDGEDENRLRHRFLKKRHDVNFSKVQVWLENCSNFGNMLLLRGCSLRNCLRLFT